jgi:large repetitive protein
MTDTYPQECANPRHAYYRFPVILGRADNLGSVVLFSGMGFASERPRRSRKHRFSALGAASVVLALLGGLVGVAPAFAGPLAVLDISQAVDHPAVGPGDSFTYSIDVDCSSSECTNASLTDVLPAEFDALTLSSAVAVTPPKAGASYTTSWGGPNNRTLTVNFLEVGGAHGIAAGDGYTVQITMSVPAGLSPDFGSNGIARSNPASVSADDADTKTSSQDVTVTIPVTVDAGITKVWSPTTAQYKVGAASTVSLTAKNQSNALATSIVLQDPADPTSTSNPFQNVDFASFGTLTLPAGADEVFVDAYVGTAWINGTTPETPSTLALPAGVTAGQVEGLRFTFDSSTGNPTLVAGGAAATEVLNVTQRAGIRKTGASLVLGATASDTASSTVTVPGQTPVSKTATATYVVTGLNAKVTATKSFTPSTIAAGSSTIALVTAANASNGPLTSMTVTEPTGGTFFTPLVAFGGFTASSTWPTGATDASIVWSVNTGTAPTSPDFTSAGANMPATPVLTGGQYITGFAITYTGAIAVGATAGDSFRVNVAGDENTNPAAASSLVNHATVGGTNDAGSATPAVGTATLSVLAPQIVITETKTVTPTAAIAPGGHSTVQLKTAVTATTGYVPPTTITIKDLNTGSALDYWNAFNAVAIAPTQVPLGSTLQVSYTTDGTTWVALPLQDATAAALWYSAALPSASTIVGLEFVFQNSNGFSLSSSVTPAIAFEARSTLRSGGPTATVGSPVTYTNSTTAEGDAVVQTSTGPEIIADTTGTTAPGIVKALPGGDDGMLLSKAWQPVSGSTAVPSQSSQSRVARISWGTQLDGTTSALITDPSNATTAYQSTVFQAFDLTKINAITTATDPLIAFDQITSVQLLNRTTGVWTNATTGPTACNATATNPCQGGYPGITLTATQSDTTVGVRMTIVPDDALRAASHDPLAPPVGSGLASSPTGRPLDLTFTLRNKLRDPSVNPANPWVLQAQTYNTPDAGVVSNTASGTFVTAAGTVTDTGSDTINIIDPSPALTSTKAVTTAAIPIPNPGDVPVANYPTDSYTLTATNASVAHAWYLRTTDPMPCAAASVASCANNDIGATKGETINPYAGAVYDSTTNPFEQFDITNLTFTVPASVSLPNSTITFLTYTPATSSTPAVTATTAPVALTPAEVTLLSAPPTSATFANVVGFSVLFASTSITNGGTIASGAVAKTVVGTRLRATTRSTSGLAVPTYVAGPTSVVNNSFTQDYDDVLPDANVYDSKQATVLLAVGSVKVTASKSMKTAIGSLTTILETNRAADVAVTLGATSGTSDAASDTVILTDSGQNTDGTPAAFWSAFTLKSIGTITPPLGSNQLEIDAQVDGSTTWTNGTPTAFTTTPSVSLPSGVTAAHVTGLRFTFSKSDGSIFSNTAPAAAWTASIPLTANLKSTYLAGQVFTGSIPNTVTTTSHHPIFGTASASATASISLSPGTATVDVVKTPSVSTTPAGQFVDWTLQFTNTGTGYLKNPTIMDQLPADASLSTGGPLLFDPTAVPTYTDSSGGLLSTTTATQTYNAATRQVSFAWPAGSQLAPGEVYTIVVSLQVAPGLQATYGHVTNKFTFGSDQTLASCTNTSGTQGFTLSGKTCLTSNFVTVLSASAITTFKGVKGNVDSSGNSTSGATNVSSPSTPCVTDSDGFYRTPCAANTVIGGTDLWKLQMVNGGNIPATAATIADVLPHAGDTLMRTSTSRGSTFTPQFNGNVTLITDSLSAGTTMTWEVTTASNPCPAYDTNPTCSTATWVAGPSYPTANYKLVTAIRLTFDFSNVTASPGSLPPAAGLKVTYDTLNTPSLTSTDHRAPTTVPSASALAWNTFGAYAAFGASQPRLVEPVKAGVEVETGSIQVNKVITGPSASFAPVSYTVNATCTIDGAPLTLPGGGAMTLNASSTIPYATRIDGLPVGSVCTFVETASGASSVDYAPAISGNTAAQVTVTTPGSSATVVPAGQQATVTNTYGFTSLTVTKHVATTTTVGSFGPYSFTLSCTVNNGVTLLPVTFAGGGTTLAFDLSKDGSNEIDNLPVDAVCALRETDSSNATSIAASVDGAASTSVVQGAAITVALAAGSNHTAVVTNTFAGGQLAITKTVSDTGSITYGSGPFTVSVLCTYQGQTLYDSTATDPTLSIVGGQTITLPPVFPVGTSCGVTETDAGGATSSTGPATVLIVGPTGGQTVGLVTTNITNTFAKGSLKITKVVAVANDAIQNYGVGPFQATVTCTWQKGAQTLTIPLPNAGLVDLSASNSYTATVTGLIAGASCAVVENKTGGATTSIVSAVSPATIPANGTSDVTITNTFKTGSLIMEKARLGTFIAVNRFGLGTYTASVVCSYISDGTVVPIDLGAQATQTFDVADSYSAEIDGLLDGATCTVAETDAGLAVSSSLVPSNGTVTIVDGTLPDPATVTINNNFAVGQLQIVKTASTSLTEGSDTYSYTLAVSNTGTVNAPGVEVNDPIDPTLDVTSVVAPGWATCGVTGAVDNYGGTLDCVLAVDLAAGSSAPSIVLNVTVLDTIAQDEIDNTATVCSTSAIFDCATGSANVPVKWIDVTASAVCVKDAPYLQYSVNAHNLDVSNHSLTVNWASKTGTLVHTDTSPIAVNGPVTGTLLWPGASVDSSGNGTDWPGYRLALPGETPDWNGLVLDPTVPTYALRDHPLITFSINPHRTITVAYPAASVDCNSVQPTDIAITKTASVSVIQPEVPFTYTIKSRDAGLGAVENAVLTDPIPATLHVTKIATVPAAAGMPDWVGCVLTGVNPDGGGGTVTCTLDRPLTYGQSAPDVVLTTFVSASAPIGMITNTATMTGDPSAPSVGPVMSADSSASVLDTKVLGLTGVVVGGNLMVAIALLLLGLLFVGFGFIWTRMRRRGESAAL